ncbi:MAG: helix-turn-helix transcriptional regulator [Paracoccus sp. (in: a-proteobacteria)]|nr:helix-turn-helix transcriptional regulator [Paracoccus sp. (in: a-proteobacteria)]
MNKAVTPTGAEMIVLTAAEYNDLLERIEDAGDIALFDDARENDRGHPGISMELIVAIERGEIHPLAAWRKAAGLTQTELADRAGLRTATVSDIESGKIDPRLSSMKALAEALGLDLDSIAG